MTPAQRLAGNIYTAAGTPVFSRQLAARKVEVIKVNQETISSAKVWSAAMGVLGLACFVAGATMMVYGFKAVPLDMALLIGGGVTTLGGVVAIIFIARVVHNSIATESENVRALRQAESKEVTVEEMISQIEKFAEGDAEDTTDGIVRTLSDRPLAFPEVIARANEYFVENERVPSGEAQGRIFAAMAQQTTELGKGVITGKISSGLAIALLAELKPEHSAVAGLLMKQLVPTSLAHETPDSTFQAMGRHPTVLAEYLQDKLGELENSQLDPSKFYDLMSTQDKVSFLGTLKDGDYSVLDHLVGDLLKKEGIEQEELVALAHLPEAIARVIQTDKKITPVSQRVLEIMEQMTQNESHVFFEALGNYRDSGIYNLLFAANEKQLPKVVNGVKAYPEVVAQQILNKLEGKNRERFNEGSAGANEMKAKLALIVNSLGDVAQNSLYRLLESKENGLANLSLGKGRDTCLNLTLRALLRNWNVDFAASIDDEIAAEEKEERQKALGKKLAKSMFTLLSKDTDRFAELVSDPTLKINDYFVHFMVESVNEAEKGKLESNDKVVKILNRATRKASQAIAPIPGTPVR